MAARRLERMLRDKEEEIDMGERHIPKLETNIKDGSEQLRTQRNALEREIQDQIIWSLNGEEKLIRSVQWWENKELRRVEIAEAEKRREELRHDIRKRVRIEVQRG